MVVFRGDGGTLVVGRCTPHPLRGHVTIVIGRSVLITIWQQFVDDNRRIAEFLLTIVDFFTCVHNRGQWNIPIFDFSSIGIHRIFLLNRRFAVMKYLYL